MALPQHEPGGAPGHCLRGEHDDGVAARAPGGRRQPSPRAGLQRSLRDRRRADGRLGAGHRRHRADGRKLTTRSLGHQEFTMEWFTGTLKTYPEIAIFLTLALGY